MSTQLLGSKWWVTTLNGEVVSMKKIEADEPDEVLHCTGVVTEYELSELKKRIASGTTTADDVVLLDKVLKYVNVRTTR